MGKGGIEKAKVDGQRWRKYKVEGIGRGDPIG